MICSYMSTVRHSDHITMTVSNGTAGKQTGRRTNRTDEQDGDTLMCGYGRFTPSCLQVFNTPKAALAWLCWFACLQGKASTTVLHRLQKNICLLYSKHFLFVSHFLHEEIRIHLFWIRSKVFIYMSSCLVLFHKTISCHSNKTYILS